MDMDKEIRPQSRGSSSCGNRSLNSTQNLNATSGSIFNTQQLPGTPHEVNVMRFDDDDEGEGREIPDLNLMNNSRKLNISELRKINNSDEDANSNVMSERNQSNINNNAKGSISSQRRSISEQRNQESNKENELSRRKLPPSMPSQKRKNKLEP